MGEIAARDSYLKWTVPASAALHGLLILLVVVRFVPPAHMVPIGVEISYNDGSDAVKAQKHAVQRHSPRAETGVGAKKEQATQQQAQNPGRGTMGSRDGAIVSALERYKYELRLFLDSRKIYPETARRLSQTGTVVVQFRVGHNGEIADVTLEKPAASQVLNKAALDLVKKAERFKPIPEEAKMQELKLSFPIEYIL